MVDQTRVTRNSVGGLWETPDGAGLSLTEAMTGGVPLGYFQIEDLSQPVQLEPPAGSLYALILAEGAGIRWRDDGEAPTAAEGMPLDITGELRYDAHLGQIWFIETTPGAKLNVSYYGVLPDAG